MRLNAKVKKSLLIGFNVRIQIRFIATECEAENMEIQVSKLTSNTKL